MAELGYSIKGDRKVMRGLDALSKYTNGERGMDRTLKAVGLRGKQSVMKAFRLQASPKTGRPWPGHAGSTKATKRGSRKLHETGLLLGSIQAAPLRISSLSVTFGTNRKGARILHTGGTITPTKSNFLTIPLSRAAKNAGSIRRFSKRGGGGGFFFNSKAGNLIFGTSTNGKLEAHWLLVKKVVIPARPFMELSGESISEIKKIFRTDAMKAYERGLV